MVVSLSAFFKNHKASKKVHRGVSCLSCFKSLFFGLFSKRHKGGLAVIVKAGVDQVALCGFGRGEVHILNIEMTLGGWDGSRCGAVRILNIESEPFADVGAWRGASSFEHRK